MVFFGVVGASGTRKLSSGGFSDTGTDTSGVSLGGDSSVITSMVCINSAGSTSRFRSISAVGRFGESIGGSSSSWGWSGVSCDSIFTDKGCETFKVLKTTGI